LFVANLQEVRFPEENQNSQLVILIAFSVGFKLNEQRFVASLQADCFSFRISKLCNDAHSLSVVFKLNEQCFVASIQED
jgi:hypothetical protein